MLCLISLSGAKRVPALLAKNFQRRHPIFGTFSVQPPVIYNSTVLVQLKTLAQSARYSTFKYTVTLKPGLGFTKGHRKHHRR